MNVLTAEEVARLLDASVELEYVTIERRHDRGMDSHYAEVVSGKVSGRAFCGWSTAKSDTVSTRDAICPKCELHRS